MGLLIVLCLFAASTRAGKVDDSSVASCVDINMISPHHATIPMDLLSLHCESVVAAMRRYSRPYTNVVVKNDLFPITVIREPPVSSIEVYSKLFRYATDIVIGSGCETIACIVEVINGGVWNITDPPIVFVAAPPNSLNSYGVDQTMSQRNSSCTGLGVFLVTVLRMVGVPARVAGVPHWNLGPSMCPLGDASPACGNHNWVEVFDPAKGWSFVDQRRVDLQSLPMNNSWFYPDQIKNNLIPFSGNHSVYTTSYLSPRTLVEEGYPAGENVFVADNFPMVWDWTDRSVFGWDMSAAYAQPNNITYQIEEF